MTKVYNFSAGPAVLPEEVLKEAAEEMLDCRGAPASYNRERHRQQLPLPPKQSARSPGS